MNSQLFSTRHVTASDQPASGQHHHQHPSDRPRPGSRALVLGGGGSAGNAWLIGVVAGLFEAGLDACDADLIIGTSAGATAAAQITGASAAGLFADILAAEPAQPTGPVASDGGRARMEAATEQMRRTSEIIASATDPADMRRRLGAAALETDAASHRAGQERWRATVATRLPSQQWPQQAVQITAVDAQTGEPVVFDRDSGVGLVDAVAASCSNGFAYRIGDGRYIDGGYRRSSENADLASGCEWVLVLSPLGGRSRAPQEWGMQLAAQVDELRAGGSRVESILPDADALGAFGASMMDLSARPGAARAGFEQGAALASRLGEFWG